ncbi:MAG: hypothetical protein ACHP7O_03165, partial [Burkholderiales bacterium]
MTPIRLGQILAIAATVAGLSACGGDGPELPNQSQVTPQATAAYHAVQMSDPAGLLAQHPWIGTGIGSTMSPSDMQTHYSFPSAATNTGAGQTIAIVDAPGSGNIVNDLNTFSSYYGLPTCATSPCFFTKTDLSNGAKVSSRNDWAIEIALDVEWAHSMAPNANIVLVIAKSSSMTDMMNAVTTAANIPGVVAVSMSWGAAEFSAESSYDSIFGSHPG